MFYLHMLPLYSSAAACVNLISVRQCKKEFLDEAVASSQVRIFAKGSTAFPPPPAVVALFCPSILRRSFPSFSAHHASVVDSISARFEHQPVEDVSKMRRLNAAALSQGGACQGEPPRQCSAWISRLSKHRANDSLRLRQAVCFDELLTRCDGVVA